MADNSQAAWIKMPWGSDSEIETLVASNSARKLRDKVYTKEDLHYISHVNLSAVKGSLDVSDVELEKLRILCRSWDIDLRPSRITSHRKFIGPLIVAIKKLLFPLIRFFLKDLIQQQRSYNAASLALIAEIAARKGKDG